MKGIEKRFYSFNKKFQEKIIDKIDERIFYWKKIMPYYRKTFRKLLFAIKYAIILPFVFFNYRARWRFNARKWDYKNYKSLLDTKCYWAKKDARKYISKKKLERTMEQYRKMQQIMGVSNKKLSKKEQKRIKKENFNNKLNEILD